MALENIYPIRYAEPNITVSVHNVQPGLLCNKTFSATCVRCVCVANNVVLRMKANIMPNIIQIFARCAATNTAGRMIPFGVRMLAFRASFGRASVEHDAHRQSTHANIKDTLVRSKVTQLHRAIMRNDTNDGYSEYVDACTVFVLSQSRTAHNRQQHPNNVLCL